MTREEVKTALSCCGSGNTTDGCGTCPCLHSEDDCMCLEREALEVIRQLEAENAYLRERLNNSGAYVTISTDTAAVCKVGLLRMEQKAEKAVKYWNRLQAKDPSSGTKRDAFALACMNAAKIREAIAEMSGSEAK